MSTSKPYLPAIASNLTALRAILASILEMVTYGVQDAEAGNQNGAAGSVILIENQLKDAGIIAQAVIALHRQS
jgi:hypothetical protein